MRSGEAKLLNEGVLADFDRVGGVRVGVNFEDFFGIRHAFTGSLPSSTFHVHLSIYSSSSQLLDFLQNQSNHPPTRQLHRQTSFLGLTATTTTPHLPQSTARENRQGNSWHRHRSPIHASRQMTQQRTVTKRNIQSSNHTTVASLSANGGHTKWLGMYP